MVRGTMSSALDSALRFETGEQLFREGDACEGLHVLCSGSVRVTKRLDDRAIAIDVAGPGDVIGEDALVTGRYGSTASALEPTETRRLDALTLEVMIAEDATFAVRFARTLIRKLDASGERFSLLARPSAGRLALALVRLAERIGRPDPDGTLIPRRLRELAVELGLDEAALGEASTTLVRERLIRIKKHGIVVPEASRMYEFVTSSDANGALTRDSVPVKPHGA